MATDRHVSSFPRASPAASSVKEAGAVAGGRIRSLSITGAVGARAASGGLDCAAGGEQGGGEAGIQRHRHPSPGYKRPSPLHRLNDGDRSAN